MRRYRTESPALPFWKKSSLVALAALAGATDGGGIRAANAQQSQLVFPGANGRLVYAPANARGDTIPDFSNCGYRGGGVGLPAVPVKSTVAADGNEIDDLPRLQRAVDAVARLPVQKGGWRGALLLKKGRYLLSGPLKIVASGVVLRGEGPNENGTVMVATLAKQHSLIQIGGAGQPTEVADTRQSVLDDYVPVGARSFRVPDAARFRVGNQIIVQRPSTAAWIAAIGMDRIPVARGGGTVQWAPGSKNLDFERVVTKIEGQRIFIDAPLVNALQKEYGGGSVYKYEFAARLSEVGVENLRGESRFDAKIVDARKKSQFADEEHGWNFISLNGVRDGWVRDVTSRYFGYSCVNLAGNARNVTVQDCNSLDPVSKVEGGRRYAFAIAGQLNLVQRCYSTYGRHDFVMHAVVPGPNVFLDCKAVNSYSDSGPHHRWATGTLYDGVEVNSEINVRNRGNSGTGHGWAGSQMVFWNCKAGGMICEAPPTSQNYAIGCIATKTSGDGWWESTGTPIRWGSLYHHQLEDRVGKRGNK